MFPCRWRLLQQTTPKLNTFVRCTWLLVWCHSTLYGDMMSFTLSLESPQRQTPQRGSGVKTELDLYSPRAHAFVWLFDSVPLDCSQVTQTKIRIHGSRKKGVIIESDILASNGVIHLINKVMDSVSPTVESDTQVKKQVRCILYIHQPLSLSNLLLSLFRKIWWRLFLTTASLTNSKPY